MSIAATNLAVLLLDTVRSGDLSRARSLLQGKEHMVDEMKPHQRSVIRRACRQWGAPPLF